MQLKEGEEVIKVFHHHYTTLIFREVLVALLSVPFFLVASFFTSVLSPWQMFLFYSSIALIFGLVILYDGVLFHMDRLIITNMRIVYIDWQNALSRSEHQAELSEIQDIETKETGVLSFLPMFDYGTFILETAAAHTIIKFTDAPDPEGIKHFIYQLLRKPNRIRTASSALSDDKARQTIDEAASVARRQ